MNKLLEQVKADIEFLKDEIKLQAHLGKAEAADELGKLEKKWDEAVTRFKPLADEAGKTAENTGAALKAAAEELKEGCERIRKLL